ncbi:hypothetical protein [Shewanella sp. SR44-3]|uniref:hypothetical protein n=1 Tax=unclassified Shewanella TaxID=196818 RepID=UPI0015F8EAF4|nr:hypothetical protein [Shewanella sp. SR44-3]MBB1267872.1 hypothetical protein [Shewanella sp. SR44-3]
MFPELNSYFSVPHSFAAYLTPWSQGAPLPDEDELREMQSTGLQLLSEVKTLEADCLMQLRHLDNEAKAVVDFLKLQSRKVDLVLQHILEKQIQEGEYHQGLQFGGSGFSIASPKALLSGSVFKSHIYISSELVALLCFCTVVSCKPQTTLTPMEINHGSNSIENANVNPDDVNADTGYLIELEFSQILDTDVEQLVKASLNVQQKMLKKRKKQRQQAT